jgi:hypothetical protein
MNLNRPARQPQSDLPVAVHAEAGFQFFELIGVALAGRVDVLGFGNEAHVVAAGDALLAEDGFVGTQVFAVHDHELVLVELHFLRQVRVEDGDSGAAVVGEQVLEVPESALEDRHVDVFAVQVGVTV